MNPADYDFLCEFLLNASGLALGPGKEYLLNSRLVPVAQSWDLNDVSELVEALRKGDRRLEQAVVEAMTTNETSFFRDKQPFDELRTILLPPLISSRLDTRRLRFWSAAASTGQEAYTIALVLEEHFPELHTWDVDIVGTDISTEALKKASDGLYTQLEVQRGLPVGQLLNYFKQEGQLWRIDERLRKRVVWSRLNLLDNFSHLGRFDVIFCRNVLIYFDVETKRTILDRLSRVLASDGFLILGAAETVLGLSDRFQRYTECKSAVYRPTGKPGRNGAAPNVVASAQQPITQGCRR